MRITARQAVLIELSPYDPFGGPAYGRRDMPFAAIGGAIAGAVGSAFAAGSAAAVSLGAAAGGVLATAAGVISAVGLVATWVGVGLTVVGAVTGNQDLMKIGGYVGLAGGVVGLGVAGINAAFSTAATATTGAATSEAAAQGASATQGTNAAVGNAVSEAGSQLTQNLSQQAGTNLATQGASGSGLLNAGVGTAPGIASAPSLGSTGVSTIQTGADLTVSGIQDSFNSGLNNVVAETAKAGKGVVGEGTSFFDKLASLDISKYNGIMNIGGEVLKGMSAGSANDDLNDIRRGQLGIQQQQLALEQSKFGYDKMAAERAYKNANTQGRLNLRTRDLTPEEQAAAAAKKNRTMAQILTQPAGAR